MDAPNSMPPPPPPPSPGAPPASAPPRRPWGTSRVFGGLFALLVLVAIEGTIVTAFDPGLESVGAKLVLQAMLAATMVVTAFWMAASEGTWAKPADLGLRPPRAGSLRLAVTAYIAYFAFALVYSQLVSPHQKDLTRDLGYGDGVAASIIAGLLIVLAAPISEEIFFRGFVFGGFRNRMPAIAAGVVSAVIFGAFHYTGPGSLTVLPQLAVLGLALAWLYDRSGSIYPTIGVHMLNNAIAFAILTH